MSSQSQKKGPKPKGKPTARKGNPRKQSVPLTNTARDLPDRKFNVGDKDSNRMAAASSNLVAESQMTAMTGTISEVQVADLLANSRLYAIARTLVHKLCVSLPGEAGSAQNSATVWSPVGALSYLVWALFDSLRSSGSFQQAAMINAFPPFPKDLNIPVAWAEALKYLKPFRLGTASAMFVDNTLTALPAVPSAQAIATTTSSYGQESYGTRSTSHPYAANAESASVPGAALTWATVQGAAPYLSNVWSRGMACVTYAEIPDFAPDASAYAVPTATSGLACWCPKFNPEIAYVLGVAGAPGQAYTGMNAYMKPAPVLLGLHPSEFWWVENLQMCRFSPTADLSATLKTHAWNQAEFADRKSPHGRIRYRRPAFAAGTNGQPVRFLLGNSIALDTRTYQALIGCVLAAINPASGVTSFTPAQCYALGVVAMSALIAKVLPYSYQSMISGAVIDTCFDPSFMDVPLPTCLSAVLNSIGPIAVDGRMIYPQISPINGAFTAGAWINFSTVGIVNTTTALFTNIYGGTNALDITVGPFAFTAATYATTSGYASTPMNSSQAFIAMYNMLFGNVVSAPAVAVVKPDSHNPVGKANQLVVADVSTIASNNSPSVASAGITCKSVLISSVGAYKCLAGDELGLALSVPVAYPMDQTRTVTTVAAINPPYRAQLGAGGRPAPLIELATTCNSATVQEAIGTALATVPRQTKEIGGMTVDVSSNGDLFGAILDKVVGPIFGDRVAVGIKNSPVGKLASHALPMLAGGPGLYAADKLGITDGVLSTFGLGKPINGKQIKQKAASGLIRGATQLLGAL